MKFLMIKYFLTSLLIVAVSEAARHGQRWAALLAALPFVATFSLIWMNLQGLSNERLASFALETFWYVLPTLPLFLVFAYWLPRIGFWPALLAGAAISSVLFLILTHWLSLKGHSLL